MLNDAQEYLDRWAGEIPMDKLEGYWSLLLVRLRMAQKRYADAIAEARTLVRVNPASNYAAKLLWLAADCCRRLGKDDQAAALLKQIAQKYPESPLAAEATKALGRNAPAGGKGR